MITPELIDYVRAQRSFNVMNDAIVEALLGVGWTQIDVEEAFVLAETTPSEEGASGVFAKPEFIDHNEVLGEDGKILEETTVENVAEENAKQFAARTKARFPEGLLVMPKNTTNQSDEVIMEMRPAEENPLKKDSPILRGMIYALVFVVIATLVAVFFLYMMGYRDLQTVIQNLPFVGK